MTFLTLWLVLAQTVSVGVVDKPMVLANGTRLLPGDRVLAIHDSTHPWLILLPSGEFLPLDSSRVVISGEWHAPEVLHRDHPEVDSGLWSEPDRRSQRVPWHAEDQRLYFSPYMPTAFNHRDTSFWASKKSGEETIWFPLTRSEALGSISSFGPSADSSRARVLFELADALWLKLSPGRPWEPDTAWSTAVARLYERSFEASKRWGDRGMAANALLMMVGIDVERRADSTALALCKKGATEFVGVKTAYGRTDAYAYWQMMELAWRHNDTAQTRSLARKIILDYPTEGGRGRVITRVGYSGARTYGEESVWFDIRAAGRLLSAAAGDDSQGAIAANFLKRSASPAVRYLGFEKQIALGIKRSDIASVLSYARTALALPHYWQLEVWPPSGCGNQGGSRWRDFKVEFIDSLDVLLPFADLLRLYDGTYNSKDTMMSRDAANWFMRQIERGRVPPRDGILNRIEPPRNSADLKRALLVSMTDAPQFKTAVECSLFIHRPDDYPDVNRTFTKTLPSGSLVQPYVMREGLVRVATPDGLSGWTNARSLSGAVSLWGISAVEMPEPVASGDFNGDGVRDLGLSTMGVLDGKALAAVRPSARRGAGMTGYYRGRWVELRGDTLWLRGIGADTIGKAVPVSREVKKGACNPGSCFYFFAAPGPGDSLAWISAVDERGTIWNSPVAMLEREMVDLSEILAGRTGATAAAYQVDFTIVVTGVDSAWVLSAANGTPRGRIAINRSWKSWRGVFFNRSGYAVAKGDSLIYRDYSGSRELRVAVGKSDVKLLPPFAPSFESDIWGVGRFGQPLCPVAAEVIPVIYGKALHLISLTDGQELAKVAMSENYYDCHYDEHGIYVSDDKSFRAVTWEGRPFAVADLPLLSYPIWDDDRIVSYYSKPMGVMFEAGAALRLADAVRPLRSKWPAISEPMTIR